MAVNTIRIGEAVTKWLMGTKDGEDALKPYTEGEHLRITLLRNIFNTEPGKDGRTTLLNLTAEELDELQRCAEDCIQAAKENAGSDPSEPGLLNSANALIRTCAKAIKAGSPLVSSLVREAPAEPDPIEPDPLVELLAEANDIVHQLETALEQAIQHRRKVRRLRDERIGHLAPYRTTSQLAEMFKMDPSQVSRIKSDQRQSTSES